MSIVDIAFEQIRDNYYWGTYGDFRVIIDISNGYINATHLCGLAIGKNGNKKEFRMWKQNTSVIELISEVSLSVRIPPDELIITPANLPNNLRGSYAHPKLIPHIASWASVKFAVKVSDIINAHLVREYKDSLRMKDLAIDRLEQVVAEQTKKIDELLHEVKASREDNSHMLLQLDTVTSELEGVSITNDELNIKVDNQTSKINVISAKLEIATDQRVPPSKQIRCGEVFGVYYNPITYKYYMIRRQKKTYSAGVTNCIRNGYTKLIYCSDSPNAVNLGNRIKDIFPADLGHISGVIITLAANKTTTDLLEYINAAEREKKNI